MRMALDTATFWTIFGLGLIIVFWGFDKIMDFIQWRSKQNEKSIMYLKTVVGAVYFVIGLYMIIVLESTLG